MNKLSLNFFGELAEIPTPPSLQSLYTEIVSKFSFDPSDVSEFLLYYTKNHQKIFIKTNDDFLCFLTENIPTIMIDIPEQSRLYKAQMKELENKALTDELEVLRTEREQLKKDLDEKKKHNNKLINEKREQIALIKKEILSLKLDHKKEADNAMLLINDKDKAIYELEMKLGIVKEKKKTTKNVVHKQRHKKENDSNTITDKVHCDVRKKEKKDKKKKIKDMIKHVLPPKLEGTLNKIIDVVGNKLKDSDKKAVHMFVECDGCGKCPIVGARYKCVVCEDFDYCEECEMKYCDSQHCHPFIKISRPELNPRSILCCVGDWCQDYQNKFK